MVFFNGLCQNNGLLGNGGLSKIRSLHCFEVLWIHIIDAICRNMKLKHICHRSAARYVVTCNVPRVLTLDSVTRYNSPWILYYRFDRGKSEHKPYSQIESRSFMMPKISYLPDSSIKWVKKWDQIESKNWWSRYSNWLRILGLVFRNSILEWSVGLIA